MTNRRQFLHAGKLLASMKSEAESNLKALAGGTSLLKPMRMGFVGIGGRGTYHLTTCLNFAGVEVKALCDINPDYLYRAKRYVEEAGQPSPALYDRGPTDWLRLCERPDLDMVVTATPWQFHAPICVAAMKNGKHAATEVPAALTLEECWELVETSEKTGKHTIMLEQVNYASDVLRLLNMAQNGVFGDLLHAEGGYVHDLRLVKTDPEEEPWRMQFDFDHNCNLYPTHPIGPIAWWFNINRGDRFETIVSMSSKSGSNRRWVERYYGPRHPYAAMPQAQGDSNTSLISTARGKTVTLHYDTNTPHPHTDELRLQGSKGIWSSNLNKLYIEGRSAEPHQWEDFGDKYKEFDHPLFETIDVSKLKAGRGHGGHRPDTPLMWLRYFMAIENGVQPDMPVTDAATWSAIVPLSGRSVAARSSPVDFPDFTRGRWKTTPPVKLV